MLTRVAAASATVVAANVSLDVKCRLGVHVSLTDLVRLPGRVAAMASRLVVDHQDRNESLAGRRRGWVEGGEQS
jgi:hypothetical protein